MERKKRRTPRDPRVQNDYIRKKYDRLNILVPKGGKAVVEDYALERSKSVNQVTNEALLAYMAMNEWPRDTEMGE